MKKEMYELTNPQKNIWELEQINGRGTSINHILSILKLKGNLDEAILVETMYKIVEVNDSFHLKFVLDGSALYQYVDNSYGTTIDIKHLNTEDISSVIDEYQALKLTIDDLFRFCLVFTPCYTYVVYKSHHIIADAWSMTQIADQIKEFYEILLKKQNSDIEIPIKPSYLSFISREKAYSETNKFNIDEQFWKDYVSQFPSTKVFPNSNPLDKNGKRYTYPLNSQLYQGISQYCEDNKITVYSFFLGILSIYFNKLHNLQKVVFGTPFLNRQKRFKELECTGMFISTLPLMVEIHSKDTFLSLCKKITSNNLSLYKHANFPYHKIQEMKENTALYEIGFSYQINKQETVMENEDLGECTWLFSGQQNNPLTIHLISLNNDKILNYDYLLDCFTRRRNRKNEQCYYIFNFRNIKWQKHY